jgi:hypothetical protein
VSRKPCWKAGTSSLKYNDHDATPDGILKPASAGQPGTSADLLRGKGANLAMPALGWRPGHRPPEARRRSGLLAIALPTANRNDAKQYRASIRH